MSHKSIRPRIQRAFLSWYKHNRDRFTIALQLGRRNDRSWRFQFVGMTPQVSAYLSRNELGIAVEWRDECWDLLACFEAAPIMRGDFYVCDLCPAEQKGFPLREALWFDHLFEPFLEWVNNSFAPAHWLELQAWGGSTQARLTSHPGASAPNLISIPLRTL